MFRDARALACTLVVAEFAWRALLVTHLQSSSAHTNVAAAVSPLVPVRNNCMRRADFNTKTVRLLGAYMPLPFFRSSNHSPSYVSPLASV